VDDDRPGFIVIDDIDGENDTPLTTEKRIRALTKKVLPAGAQNLAVLAVQNLVHPDSVFAQLVDRRADFLADRELIGPIPAVRDLNYEARDGRWVLTGGTPTWAGQDLARCQEMVNDFGLEAFLSECQHEVETLAGGLFQREWFPIVDAPPAGARTVRFWDKAATAPNRANPDPDWTRGARVSITNDRRITIEDIVGIRADPGGVEALIAQTAALDGKRTAIRIEQEPGSSGKDVIAHYVTDVLQGYDIEGVRSTGSKEERAAPVSSQAKVGNIRLVRGERNNDFLSEAVRFPLGAHDDQVDAVSGALAFLADGGLPMQWITKSTEFRAKHLPAPETDEQRTARRLAEYLAQQNG
jgi:predicted phage terminase large subunit-like protein